MTRYCTHLLRHAARRTCLKQPWPATGAAALCGHLGTTTSARSCSMNVESSTRIVTLAHMPGLAGRNKHRPLLLLFPAWQLLRTPPNNSSSRQPPHALQAACSTALPLLVLMPAPYTSIIHPHPYSSTQNITMYPINGKPTPHHTSAASRDKTPSTPEQAQASAANMLPPTTGNWILQWPNTRPSRTRCVIKPAVLP
ncbi:hypothetical protein COO60DRAFT_360924 [Scenedesmus sp. NREL 46B-D3]|nr:hypothetical protein COO60DRAFT_360924 [Scenedesmus sp. NREL 46B-D3]